MIDKRTLLYIALAFIGFLLWNQWQTEHAPVVEQKSSIEATATPASGAPSTTPSTDLPPEAAVAAQQGGNAAGAASSVAQATATHGDLVTISSDTLKLVIDTKGGNILKASLPQYPEKVDSPDVPVQIFSDSPAVDGW